MDYVNRLSDALLLPLAQHHTLTTTQEHSTLELPVATRQLS